MQRSPFTIRSTIFRYENKIARNHKNIIRISINSRCAKSIRITGFSYDLASEEWRTVNLNAIKKSVIRFALCTDITNFNYHKWLKFACCRNRSRRLNHRQLWAPFIRLCDSSNLSLVLLLCCHNFLFGHGPPTKKKIRPILSNLDALHPLFCNQQIKISLRNVCGAVTEKAKYSWILRFMWRVVIAIFTYSPERINAMNIHIVNCYPTRKKRK